MGKMNRTVLNIKVNAKSKILAVQLPPQQCLELLQEKILRLPQPQSHPAVDYKHMGGKEATFASSIWEGWAQISWNTQERLPPPIP